MDENSIVLIKQYDGPSGLWYIKLASEKLIPRRKDMPDWSKCPGTLYQDYETWEEAAEAARWWGFEPV